MTPSLRTRTEWKRAFDTQGYVIVRQLWSRDDVLRMRTTFDEMHALGEIPGCFKALSLTEALAKGDILQAFPRMMHPHRVSPVAMAYLLDPRVMTILETILEEPAMATQSMLYWKPPGARGQALHQDNYYLKVEPGTCVAAWSALDDADEENGSLAVVAHTQNEVIQCPHAADPEKSFTSDEVDLPPGATPVTVEMKAGDVLFFNGNLIHGSYPNRSQTRFRRAFICHYAGLSTRRLSHWYFPLYAADGTIIEREVNTSGGPCGADMAAAGPH